MNGSGSGHTPGTGFAMSRAARVWTGVAIVAIVVVVAGVVVSRPGFDAPFTDVVDEWAVGMAVGPGPVDLTLAPEDPVITAVDVADDGGVGVADPFLVRTDDGWLMFYEVIRLDERGPNGERAVIGVAGSDDAIDWQHWGIVLEEPFHLSYPGVFEDDGAWYMVPESGEAGRVILYEATAFPMEWAESKTLLEGVYRDPTVFAHGGTWWMFATDSGDVDDDTLRLFMAPELNGQLDGAPCESGGRR